MNMGFANRDAELRELDAAAKHAGLLVVFGRWRAYSTAEKRKLIHDHATTVFEDVCRARLPGARRYWEGKVELDLVAPDPDNNCSWPL